jgi:hypothetical protein
VSILMNGLNALNSTAAYAYHSWVIHLIFTSEKRIALLASTKLTFCHVLLLTSSHQPYL